MIEPMLVQFTQEMATTRKMLEILPEKHLGWKPHPKSMSLGQLASHIAETPGWLGLDADTSDSDPVTYKPLDLKTVKEILAAFDKNVAEASAAMKAAEDDPQMAARRYIILSHTFHHRGQLSVYLRLKDVPLPTVYGGTADSGKMM